MGVCGAGLGCRFPSISVVGPLHEALVQSPAEAGPPGASPAARPAQTGPLLRRRQCHLAAHLHAAAAGKTSVRCPSHGSMCSILHASKIASMQQGCPFDPAFAPSR